MSNKLTLKLFLGDKKINDLMENSIPGEKCCFGTYQDITLTFKTAKDLKNANIFDISQKIAESVHAEVGYVEIFGEVFLNKKFIKCCDVGHLVDDEKCGFSARMCCIFNKKL